MVTLIAERAGAGQQAVLEDCARIFAGTASNTNIMLMAFVVYSTIGVDLADELMAAKERSGR
jgi:hypothetical protein